MSPHPKSAWLSAVLLCLLWPGITLATDADFFPGKTLTYIVGTKPGGGYDTYARLIARYLEKHLPGTRVVVENVPGAGHIIAVNRLYQSRPDGLTIATFNTGLLYAQLLHSAGVQFDLRALSWIGKAASDPRVLVVGQQTPYLTLTAAQTADTPLLLATSGLSSASHNDMALLAQALKLKVRLVPNYGGSEAELAILRGDVAGTLGSYSALKLFVDNGHGRILLRVGSVPGLDAAIPAAQALVTDDAGRALVTLVESFAELGRLTAAPPGVPAARLAVLRQAYQQALADPQLLAEAAKLGLPINPLYGETVAGRIVAALDQTPATLDLIRAVVTLTE